MKRKILNLLESTTSFISGEEISNSLGVSRAAIWKHINSLKLEGYNIEGVSKRGYRLITSPENINLLQIKEMLKTKLIGNNIVFLNETESTNIVARDLAVNPDADGTLVVARTQKSGKGRLNRPWHSPLGGIWLSILLKPNLEPIYASKITLLTAAALSKALILNDFHVKIKWPNDIILNNKKVSGVLTEMSCEMDKINYIVVGVGINVNLEEKDIPEALGNKATSLLLEGGKSINENKILCDFLYYFEKFYFELLETFEISSSIEICRELSWIIGKEISINGASGKEQAIALDITPLGQLVIRTTEGKVKTILSGDVTLTESY